MKKRITISVLLISLFLLISCQSNTTNLSGETDNWQIELEILQESDFEEMNLTLKYLNSNPSSVEFVHYSVDTNNKNFKGRGRELDENGVLQDKSEARGEFAKFYEKSEVEVIVEWDDETETIVLNN